MLESIQVYYKNISITKKKMIKKFDWKQYAYNVLAMNDISVKNRFQLAIEKKNVKKII